MKFRARINVVNPEQIFVNPKEVEHPLFPNKKY
jgi:hypothetical protein